MACDSVTLARHIGFRNALRPVQNCDRPGLDELLDLGMVGRLWR